MSTIIVPSPPIITSESGGSLELGETSTTAYRGDRGAFAYQGALDFYNAVELLENPTGFTNNENITVTYNSTNRTITLTGTFEAFYLGEKVTELVDGWVSQAHATTLDVNYYLRYDGTQFLFNTTPWKFTDMMIALVQYGTNNKVGVKETHGFMAPDSHESFHYNIGTYKTSGGSLTAGSYALNSTVLADRRPLIDVTGIKDEDLQHLLPALTTETYTQKYLTGANTRAFLTDQAEIIPVNGTVPYYNQFTGGNWVQTPIPNNNYCAVFVTAIPVTNDATSQKFRYIWVQPQTIGILSDIEAINHSDINTGLSSALLTEFVPILKLILYVSGNNWVIYSTELLTGNKQSQTGSPSGNYLTVVASDDTINGDGTALNPLTVPHVALTNNPHGVTKSQVGLGNVDNTSDANKPISTATATALAGKEPSITSSVVTSFWSGTKTFRDLATDVRAVVLTGLSTATGTAISATDTVLSAFGKLQKQIVDNLTTLTSHTGNTSNPHSVTKAQVGLGSVDNTSDASKPVSTAQQNALNLKLDATAYTASDVLTKIKTVDGTGSGLDADLLDGFDSTSFAPNQILAQYSKNVADLPTTYPMGVSVTFVSATQGWFSFGTIITTRTYSGGGGTLQTYTPYGVNFGGISHAIRYGDYGVNSGDSWTPWYKVWTDGNDGSGSGLDADTLDGSHASAFALTGHNHDSSYVPQSKFQIPSNFTSDIDAINQEGLFFGEMNSASTNKPAGFSAGSLFQLADDGGGDVKSQLFMDGNSDNLLFRIRWNTWRAWRKVWHDGNDGSGSGLDADLLDGIDSTRFAVATPKSATGGELKTEATLLTSLPSGMYRVEGSGLTGLTGTYFHIIHTSEYSSGGYASQIAIPFEGGVNRSAYIRVASGTVWGAWKKLYNSDDASSSNLANALVIRDANGDFSARTILASNFGSSVVTGTPPLTVASTTVVANLNADLLDGLDIHTGRNNEANKVVRTDVNGYIQAGYINSTSGNENNNASPDRVWGSNSSDAYLRTYRTSALSVASAVNSSTANQINCNDGDRSPNTKLPTSTPKAVRYDFINASGAGTGGNYAGLMTFAPWDGTTGGGGDASYQLVFGSTGLNGLGTPQMRLRKGIDSAWNSWYDIWTSANFTPANYAPLASPAFTGTLTAGATVLYGGAYSSSLALNSAGWVKLCTISAGSQYVTITGYVNSSNSEEPFEISVKTHYVTSLTNITLNKGTYSSRLNEVRVEGSDGGTRALFVRIDTTTFAPTLTWATSNYYTTKVTVNNEQVTPVGVVFKALDTTGNSLIATTATIRTTGDLTVSGTVTLPSTTSIGNVSSTELGYLDGVTSAIQTQLGGKEPSITASVVTSFWSGTKTFRDLATDVRAVVLTGLSLATSTAITATDTILVALGKLQAQFTTHTAVHAPSNAQKNSDITKAEIEAKLTGQIETHTHPASGVTALYDEDLTKYTRDVTVRDASNMPTEVQYKRYGTATLFMKRTYTNPDANAQFQTVTELFYDTNGTTLLYTVTWTLTYGVKGEIDTASRVIV